MNNLIKIHVLERENLLLQAQNEKLNANLDYVAMMTEVDIPTEEDTQDE